MTIPEIQERLEELAYELRHPVLFPRSLDDIANELRHLSRSLSRRKPVTRAPRQSRRMSNTLAAQMRDFWAANTHLSQQHIAERFGVTAGRVSEALAGKRT